MKYTKMLGLLAVVAAALMAFAGSASATILTSSHKAATAYSGNIEAELETGHAILHSENAPTAFTVECNKGVVTGEVTTVGSGATTAGGHVTGLSFEGCTNGSSVTVKKPGTLEIHTDKEAENINDSNGLLTSTGAEIEVLTPLGFKCIYTTEKTDVGTLTGSTTRAGQTATLDIASKTINRTGGSPFCGTGGYWTGNYIVNTPMYLDVD